MQKLKLVQWTTGKVATEAVKGVLQRPDMEFVGAFAFSPDKVGKDLGELCGLGRDLGVKATDDIDVILALEPDCVLYMPLHPDVDHLEKLLRGGANVVTTAHFMTGRAYGEEARERLEKAALAGGVSLFGSGVNPGYAEALAAAATAVSREIHYVKVLESFNIGPWAGDANQDELGWGRPEGDAGHAEDVKQATVPFGDACEALARLCGAELDDVRCDVEFAYATRDLDIPGRTVRAGTVAGICSAWIGSVGGVDVVEATVRWTISADIRPAWKVAMAYEITIVGEPNVNIRGDVLPDLSTMDSAAMTAMGSIITASPVTNAIPAVVAAKPGILGYQDLPLVTARLTPKEGAAPKPAVAPKGFTRESTVNELAVTRIGKGLRWVIGKQAAKQATDPEQAKVFAELAGYMGLDKLVEASEGKLPWPVVDGVVRIANLEARRG